VCVFCESNEGGLGRERTAMEDVGKGDGWKERRKGGEEEEMGNCATRTCLVRACLLLLAAS